MKRLVLSVPRGTITPEDLSPAIAGNVEEPASRALQPKYLKDIVSELEKRMIQDALEESKHNQLHAKALGFETSGGLIKKMRRYNITSRDS